MLYLTKEQAASLVEYSKKEYPNEACGILAGRKGRTEKVYFMANTDKSAKTFFMDPKEQFKTMKEIRAEGLEMTAIYHSHPETRAYPSAHDVELACYTEVSYIIVSLEKKDDPVIKSFRIAEGKITEEDVSIE